MTTIHKLGITGVRAFPPGEEQTIEFFQPLTIILGNNGSGKTTIIECMKMACTGDLPPMVDRGGAFIHDPRIRSSTETKATIRMQFVDAGERNIIVNRSFQLLNKATAITSRNKSATAALRSTSGTGSGMAAMASFQKQEFKTFEQSITIKDPYQKGMLNDQSATAGQPRKRTSVTTKCAEMNKIIPEMMGVSKAVLENVIFVHQEESNWPLGDGKMLKEKFDDIFAATRYTKALESIRKYRKDQAIRIRELKSELALWKDRIDASLKTQREYESTKAQVNTYQKAVEKLQLQIQDIREEDAKVGVMVNELKSFRQRIQNVQSALDVKVESKVNLQSELGDDELDVTDQELVDSEEVLNSKLQSVRDDVTRKLRNIQELKQELELMFKEKNYMSMEKGRLQASAQIHLTNQKELDNIKIEMSGPKYISLFQGTGKNVPNPSLEDENQPWKEFLNQLITSCQITLAELEHQSRKKDEDLSELVNSAKIKKNECENAARNNQKLADEKRTLARQKNIEAQSLLSSGGVSFGNPERVLEEERVRSKHAEEKLSRKRESLDLEEIQKSYEEKRKAQQEARQQFNLLNDERRFLALREDAMSKVKFVSGQIDEKANVLNGLKRDLVSSMTILIPSMYRATDINPDNAVERYKNSSTEFSIKRSKLKIDHERTQSDFSQINASLKSLQNIALKADQDLKSVLKSFDESKSKTLSFIKQEHDRIEAKMRVDDKYEGILEIIEETQQTLEPLNFETYEKISQQLEEEKKKSDKDLIQMQAGAEFYEGLLQISKRKSCCPVCDRGFENDGLERLQVKLKKKIDKANNTQQDYINEQNNFRGKVCELVKQMEPLLSDCVRLENESQMYEKKVDETRKLWEENKKMADEVSEEVKKTTTIQNQFEECGVLVMKINSLNEEIKTLQDDLERDRVRIPKSDSGKTLEEIDIEIQHCNHNLENFQLDIDRLQRTRDLGLKEINILEKAYHEARERLLSLEAKVEKQKRLLSESEELVATADKLEKDGLEATKKLKSLEDNLLTLTEEREVSRAENSHIISKKREQLRQIEKLYEDLKTKIQLVEDYEAGGSQQELESITNKLNSFDTKIKAKKDEVEQLEKQYGKNEKQYSIVEKKIRIIGENLKLRRLVQDIENDKNKISHLEGKMNQLCRHFDPEDRYNELQRNYNQLTAEYAGTTGKMHPLNERLETLEEELHKAKLKGSEEEYKTRQIELKMIELASGDLERYHRALDQSLMAYHSLKMSEINKLIKDLWQKTYKGSDIDSIEIVSDVDAEAISGTPVIATGPVKRNYNYRVVMRRGNAMLDMRGRCSAGQKVLASLVIRLALAESFCLDCGILALDEPTTNLDFANKESLALALAEIVRDRKGQKSFQLILITHDEEFINMLGTKEATDRYYLVRKNRNGCSEIVAQDLNELG